MSRKNHGIQSRFYGSAYKSGGGGCVCERGKESRVGTCIHVHNGLGRGGEGTGGMDYVWRVFMMLVVQGYSVGHGQQVGKEWVGKGRGGGGGIKGVNPLHCYCHQLN